MKKKIYMITLLIILIDQFVKHIVLHYIATLEVIPIIDSLFFLTNVKNTGGAWSILENYPYLLTLISAGCIILFNQYLFHKNTYRQIEVFSFGLLMGGVIGNFLDRILRSGVIDFIGIRFGSYQFPIFNLADIAIVIGMILVIIDMIRSEINEYRSRSRTS